MMKEKNKDGDFSAIRDSEEDFECVIQKKSEPRPRATFVKEFQTNYPREGKAGFSFDLRLSVIGKLKNFSTAQLKRLESQIELWIDIV